MNNKKHYFLKLKEDFFQQEKIMILENNKNGLVFSNIILKLYLLSMKNNGELLLSEDVPYTPELIAHQTGHKLALVEQALDQFKQLNLLEELENSTLEVVDYTDLVGSITSGGERKRAYRNRQKMAQIHVDDGTISHTSPTTVMEVRQPCPSVDTEEGQIFPNAVTEGGQPFPSTVTEEGQICLDHVGDTSSFYDRLKPTGDSEDVPSQRSGEDRVKPKQLKIKKPSKKKTTEPDTTQAPQPNEKI